MCHLAHCLLVTLLLSYLAPRFAVAEEVDPLVNAAIGPSASEQLAALQTRISRPYSLRAGESPVDSQKRLDGEVADFFAEIVALGRSVSEEALKQIDPGANTTLSFALLDMARGVAKEPALAEEILTYYGSLSHLRLVPTKVPIMRPPDEAHTLERYRYAWRVWLVAPYSDKVRNVHRSLPIELLTVADRSNVVPLLWIAHVNHVEQRAARPSARPISILSQFSVLEAQDALAGLASVYANLTPSEAQRHRPFFVNVLRSRIDAGGAEKIKRKIEELTEDEREQLRLLRESVPAEFGVDVDSILVKEDIRSIEQRRKEEREHLRRLRVTVPEAFVPVLDEALTPRDPR